jgi:hypothetical protein
MIAEPPDFKLKINGLKQDKVQVFSRKKFGRKELEEEEQKRVEWAKRLLEKREKK